MTLEARMSIEMVKTTTSTLQVDPSFEIHSSSTLVNDVFANDSTHDVVGYEVSIADTTSYHIIDFEGEWL